MTFLAKENPTFCWYFPMELNEEKKTGLGQMAGTGWMLLILLQNIYQTHCQKQCSLQKIDFLCYFSNLRILELVCENAKTQCTPWSTVSPLTHSCPLAGGWAAFGGEGQQRPPWPRTGAPTGRGHIHRAAKGPVEFRGSPGRSASQLIKSWELAAFTLHITQEQLVLFLCAWASAAPAGSALGMPRLGSPDTMLLQGMSPVGNHCSRSLQAVALHYRWFNILE